MPLIELKSDLSNINYNYNKDQKSLLDLSSKNIKKLDNLSTPVNIDSTLKENSSNIIDKLDNPIYLDYIDKVFFGAKNVGKDLYYTVDYFSARLNETVPIGFSALFNKNNVSLLLSKNQKEIVLRPLTYDVIDTNNRKFNFDVQFGPGTNWKSKFINNVGKPIEPITEDLKKSYQNIVDNIFFNRPDRQPHKIPNTQINVKGKEFSILNNNDYREKFKNYNYNSIFDIDNNLTIDNKHSGLFVSIYRMRNDLNEQDGSWNIKDIEHDDYYKIKSPFILNDKNYFYDINIGLERDKYKPYTSALSLINFTSKLTENYNNDYPNRLPYTIPNYQQNEIKGIVNGDNFDIDNMNLFFKSKAIISIFDSDSEQNKIDNNYTSLFFDNKLRYKLDSTEYESSWHLTEHTDTGGTVDLFNINSWYINISKLPYGGENSIISHYSTGYPLSPIDFESKLKIKLGLPIYPERLPYVIDEFDIDSMNSSFGHPNISIFDLDRNLTIDIIPYNGLFSSYNLRKKLLEINKSWNIEDMEHNDYYKIKSPFILNDKNNFYDVNIIGGIHRDQYHPYLTNILPIDFENSNLESKYLNESLFLHSYWFEGDFSPIINNSFIGEYTENFDYVSTYSINNTDSEESIFSNIINEINDYNLHVSRFDTIKDKIDNNEKIFSYSNLGLYEENSNNFRGINDEYNLDEYYARSLEPKDSLSIYNYESNKLDPIVIDFKKSFISEYKSPVIWRLPRDKKEGTTRYNMDNLIKNFDLIDISQYEKFIPFVKNYTSEINYSIIDMVRLHLSRAPLLKITDLSTNFIQNNIANVVDNILYLTSNVTKNTYKIAQDAINISVGISNLFTDDKFREDYTLSTDLCSLIFIYFDNKLHYNNELQFTSFLESLNEQATSEWGNNRYIGNPMNVYNYKGLNRKITFSFKVTSLSREEAALTWKKLNVLMSLCYPAYNIDGRMMSPIIKLSIGAVYKNLPGFIDSITFDVDKSSPWDINSYSYTTTENTTNALPMIVNINVSFTVIGKNNPEIGSTKSTFDSHDLPIGAVRNLW